MQSFVKQELSSLQSFGSDWEYAISQGAPEDDCKDLARLFSWKVAFFWGADTLIAVPAVRKATNDSAAKDYTLDGNKIKAQIQNVENVKPKDNAQASKILNEVISLTATTPERDFGLLTIGLGGNGDRVLWMEKQVLANFNKKIMDQEDAPLKSAADLFDLSEAEQCEILGIKN
ncbi:hypothetical protein DL93DRAFT_2158898 [Clavulina sp. PMI_390]|nr:hypothetical protein DL93DRAFT_2158898 [Clavulina sp. PMI_390]